MEPLRIYVGGPVMSGATTTLSHFGGKCTPPFSPLSSPFSREGGWAWTYRPGSAIVLLRGRTRIRGVYNLAGDADRDARLKEERDFWLRANCFVFVADSQAARLKVNRDWLEDYRTTMTDLGMDPGQIPMVFQLNKRDLPNLASVEQLQESMPWRISEYVPTVATTGEGLLSVLLTAVRLAAELSRTEK
jgi:mutual gliding-motility protein MglA